MIPHLQVTRVCIAYEEGEYGWTVAFALVHTAH